MQDTPIRIAIVGGGGRMGRELILAVMQSAGAELGAVLVRKNSPLVGQDAGELVGFGKNGIIIRDCPDAIKDDFDVLIDFTRPECTLDYLAYCLQHNKKIVIGTTGFSDAERRVIDDASQCIPVVFSANFSVGVNLMLSLLEKTARVMGDNTDIEIIEAHHRHKVDAPSGTALTMGNTIANALHKDLKDCAVYSREGHTGERKPGTIGFSTIRASDIVGEHTVLFAGMGERIEISHKASSRMTFASGAVVSAVWINKIKRGLYDMRDVLNLDGK